MQQQQQQPPYPPAYPHYPQPYPQPPRRRLTIPIALAALVILACVACPLLAHILTPNAPSVTADAMTPTPRATLAHIDNTALYSLVAGAQLGGTISAFDATYGDQVGQLGVYAWNVTLASQHTQLTITPTHRGDSRDSYDRVVIVDITGPTRDPAWNAAQDAAIVARFLPSDAQLLRITPSDEHIYTSRQLANSLAATIFTNAAGAQLAPGTFSWLCATDQQTCELGVGTNS